LISLLARGRNVAKAVLLVIGNVLDIIAGRAELELNPNLTLG
jgi:hypothetical protein